MGKQNIKEELEEMGREKINGVAISVRGRMQQLQDGMNRDPVITAAHDCIVCKNAFPICVLHLVSCPIYDWQMFRHLCLDLWRETEKSGRFLSAMELSCWNCSVFWCHLNYAFEFWHLDYVWSKHARKGGLECQCCLRHAQGLMQHATRQLFKVIGTATHI